MSSLKMTFSLTSLILIFALGLVFAPVSVMAHEVTPANSGTGQVHNTDTPVRVVDSNGRVTTAGHTNHNAHPTVTSIELKPGPKVRGNMVVVTDPSAQGGEAADAQFTLVVTFDQPVVSTNDFLTVAADVADPTADPLVDNTVLAAADFGNRITNSDNTASTATVTFAAATRVADTDDQFEAVVTIAAAFPSGTDNASDKELILRAWVNARAAFSLKTDPQTAQQPIEGGASEESSVYPFTLVNALTPAPAAPLTLAAAPADTEVTLSWADPATPTPPAVSPSITKYQYRQSADAGTTWSPDWMDITGSSATTRMHTVTGLTNGTEYTFEVRAVGAGGNGPSTSITGTPIEPPPGPVTALTTTPGNGQVGLSWTAPTTGGVIESYQYSINSGQTWMDIASSDATTVGHTVTGLTNGQTYSFTVRAVGAGDDNYGAASNESIATPRLPDAPAAPANLSTDDGDTKVVLSWGNPNNATITKYQYRQSADAGTTWNPDWMDISGSSATTTMHTVDSLTNGTEYTFEVRAVGIGGNGASSAGTATPMATVVAPGPVANLKAVPGNGQVDLTWDIVSGADSYEYRMNVGAWMPIADTNLTVTTTTASTTVEAANDAAVTFEVRAVNAAGSGTASDPTAPVTPMATVDTTPPTVISITGMLNTAGDKAVFTITFSDALQTSGAGALAPVDFAIKNGSSTTPPVLGSPTTNPATGEQTYTLTVTPMDPKLEVTIILNANEVNNMAGLSNVSASAESPGVVVQPDADPPTVKITVASTLNADGKAVFTLTFSEPLATTGAGALTLPQDIVVTNSTDAALGMPTINANGEEVYELTATPTDRLQPVMVAIDARSVIEDRYTNLLNIAATGNVISAVFDDRRPTATVIAPSVPEANGTLKFTFDFSEDIDADRLQPGTVGVDNVQAIATPVQDPSDSTIYTVLVTPADPVMSTRVEIADAYDLAGNALKDEAADTYTPSTEVPDPTITGPPVLSCLTGGTITVTFDEPLKAGEALAVGDIEITGAGWEIKNFDAANGTFDLKPKADRSWIGTTEVNVKVKKDSVVDDDDMGNTEADEDFTVGPVLTIPANTGARDSGYIVVVREDALQEIHFFDAGARNVTNVAYRVGDPMVGSGAVWIQPWECMPDLGVRFGRKNYNYPRGGTLVVDSGGGLIVKQSAAHVADPDVPGSGTIGAGTVGITEIMWAEDRGNIFGAARNFDHAREQWIELHNLNNFEVKVTLFDLIRDEAYSTIDYGEIDRMTNYNLPQYHGEWPIRDANKGQDGDSDYGEDFIAMQRGPATLAENYLHSKFDGRNGGFLQDGSWKDSRWTQATAAYLTNTAGLHDTGQLAFENLNYDFIGTPGRSNNIGETNPPVVTDVPLKPFVINEVGNRDNRLYDWIEIRNTSGAAANIRNYNISIVTGVGADESLFNFPNVDINLADGEVILVLATDPGR